MMMRRLYGFAATLVLAATSVTTVTAAEFFKIADYYNGADQKDESPVVEAPRYDSALPEPLDDFYLEETGVALLGESLSVAESPALYIDNAIVGNQLRFRYDAAYNNSFLDRAEFFYGQCGCFGGGAPGPLRFESDVDYQDFLVYYEGLLTPRMSLFAELPVRVDQSRTECQSCRFRRHSGGFQIRDRRLRRPLADVPA
jgi:hypothetical protein